MLKKMIPPHPHVYDCLRADGPVEFAGDLESGEWARAEWTGDFADIEGDLKPKPRHRTRAKMMWDDRFFYIGAEMEEPHLWATLTEHDSVIFQDNDFEVFIDPDGDNHNYFEYEVNALGTDWDLRLPTPYRDGGPALNEWETPGRIVKATLRGTLNDPSDFDQGWTIELAFPWEVFAEQAGTRCPPIPLDVWRVNFSRVEWDLVIEDGKYRKVEGRPEHNWVWSPMHVIDMHRPELWGYVRFLYQEEPAPYFDPDHEVRHLLMSIYHQQKDFRKENSRWAAPCELSLPGGAEFSGTDDGWTVRKGHLKIDHLSRIDLVEG